MDMMRIRRQTAASSPPPAHDAENGGAFRASQEKPYAGVGGDVPGFLRPLLLLCCASLVLLLVLYLSGSQRAAAFDRLRLRAASIEAGAESVSFESFAKKDKLLGGLFSPRFDEESCLSRYQFAFYSKQSTYMPSSYLLERLRNYEVLHNRCGPNTESYSKAVEQLRSEHTNANTDCKYLVWISYSGLGNRMLSLASTFLYALLTNRVLLIDRGADMADLFCEPFPESSWFLPLDFPLNQFESFDINHPKSYGNMLKDKDISNRLHGDLVASLPYVYLHLAHDYGDSDKLFFCEDDQQLLHNIPWLILRSNNYFLPSLFLVPAYQPELNKLFPEKDTVFHHLGRYLFHPTNPVWGLVTRYYRSYLAMFDERLGIQIRVFDSRPGPFQYVLDQVVACALNEKLLPDISLDNPVVPIANDTSKSVLVTSLSSGYFEKIRNMFWEHPTVTGESISVHQPSHEGYQQTEKHMHNMKALAEMYLLSMTDVLVTSAWSTFGYVAQGIGGLKPWILLKPENETAPNPPCQRAMSMEPCFHAPPFYDCKRKAGVDTGALVPHVRHCEDMNWGLKLVDHAD